ncbi:MAG TPA: family 16 glycoside hydrolase [Candidatus Binatia bacterium]|nr:family 16 glycoside hydrolase [Candidatus Binatia bacterium]
MNVAKVSPPLPKAGGRWNTFEITAKGPQMSVMMNGVKTAEGQDGKFASGESPSNTAPRGAVPQAANSTAVTNDPNIELQKSVIGGVNIAARRVIPMLRHYSAKIGYRAIQFKSTFAAAACR